MEFQAAPGGSESRAPQPSQEAVCGRGGMGALVTRGDGAASVSEDCWTVMGPGELGTTSFFRTENWRMPKKKSCSVMSNSLQPHGLYCPWNSPGQNTGVGSLFLLQGIFPTQGSNPGLPHCRQILYQLSHRMPHKGFVNGCFNPCG